MENVLCKQRPIREIELSASNNSSAGVTLHATLTFDLLRWGDKKKTHLLEIIKVKALRRSCVTTASGHKRTVSNCFPGDAAS